MSITRIDFKRSGPQILLSLFGLIMTLIAFYPGIVSSDAIDQYQQGSRFIFTDWHPPVMSFIWSITDKIIPGPFGMLLLECLMYWGSLLLLSVSIPAKHKYLSLSVIVVGFMPFALGTLSHVLKDVFHAVTWMLAVSLVAVSNRNESGKRKVIIVAGILLITGSMFRFNAVFGLIPLAWLLVADEKPWEWRKLVFAFVLFPLCALLLTSIFNYKILNASKSKAFQSLIVFDIGGISHFSDSNHFKEVWSDEEDSKIRNECYDSRSWNSYAWGSCGFVLKRLVASGAWDDGSLMGKWLEAIYHHPTAYLQHRYENFKNLLWEPGGILEDRTASNSLGFEYKKTEAFAALQDITNFLRDTPLFKPGFWLIVSLAFSLYGLISCKGEWKNLIIALNTSSFLYLLAYLFVGVASDFRYAYWSIMATSVSVPFILLSIKTRNN
ncbi:TPA: hypothetical protein J5G23_000853 [Escherichia coli]|nr:hypothetical protein [Escherichia coli]EJA1145652.1 hypothetical protein [Escherichia coli]RZY79116.1 hypothetical protein EXX26_19055 [Escherichia coli]HBA3741742.1 hypothetical protein [Escherichia coli]HBA3787184.1 hypothetical protein [Escherichia coli]